MESIIIPVIGWDMCSFFVRRFCLATSIWRVWGVVPGPGAAVIARVTQERPRGTNRHRCVLDLRRGRGGDRALEEPGEKATAEDYFLAGRELTWPLIGFSLIAANISAEQMLGMAGQSANPEIGFVIASYEWMTAITLVVVDGVEPDAEDSDAVLVGEQRAAMGDRTLPGPQGVAHAFDDDFATGSRRCRTRSSRSTCRWRA